MNSTHRIDEKTEPSQPVKRRKRSTIVCNNCKRRKTKCDKKEPCGRCVKLGDQDTCSYIKHPLKNEKIAKLTATKIPNGKCVDEAERASRTTEQSLIRSNQEIISTMSSQLKNMIPNGFLVTIKRSATTEYSLFTDVTMEHRDPYLQCLICFRHIAIGMTIKNLKANNVNLKFNPSLPHSFTPLSIFDADGDPLSSESAFRQLQLIHKSLFDKFGSYRKYNTLKYNEDTNFIAENMPSRALFLNDVMPYFESHILKLIPIFDTRLLRHEINVLYDSWEKSSNLNYKRFDHIVYSLVLLITKLCQLSMNLSKLSAKIQFPLRDLNTNKYVSIVNHFLFKMKSLRKCTLLQLQCLVLLRFYYWCGPEDGDGPELQHSLILSGTIIASCKEMGINWNCLLRPNEYYFEILPESRPQPPNISPDDYRKIYKKIWAYVVFWDRKLCLINGQDCLIDKSYRYNCSDEDVTWHEKIISFDHILRELSELLNYSPTEVDTNLLHEKLRQVRQEFSAMENSLDETLNFELKLSIGVFELCLVHAEMIHYEKVKDSQNFNRAIQQLWDHIIHMSNISMSYFNDDGRQFDPFTRFYSNKTMAVAANKICVLVPAIILRLHRFPSFGQLEKDILVRFLFGFSSLYFTEFGFDYYCCFKKMFTAKITYKILHRPVDKDPWILILEFLLHELKREMSGGDSDPKGIKSLPVIAKLQETISKVPKQDRDVLKSWDELILPIENNMGINGFDLYTDQLSPFLIDLFPNSFNLFASFYDNASSKLVDSAGNAKTTDNTQAWISSPKQDVKSGISTGEVSTTSSTADFELANLELIQDLFEPLDFMSFL